MTATAQSHHCLSTQQVLELAEGGLSPLDAQNRLANIEQCSECMAVLGEAGLAVALDAHDADAGESSRYFDSGSLLGTIVANRYRIERWLGKGGMGEVYQACDLELEECIALKTIIPRFAQDDVALRRFKREVRLARQIVHPNVCRVLEFGRDGLGDASMYFLTMELLEGKTLGEKLRSDGALPAQVALHLGAQLCAGLAAIHQAGVLHRDIKPSNIMLRASRCTVRAGDEFVATLLDFGIARMLGGSVSRGDRTARVGNATSPGPFLPITLTNQAAVGTPVYMAPEQISGERLSVATDIYSLGVVLSEMLTGQTPNLPRRSSRNGGPSSELGGIVNWCLDPDPSRRPSSAHELRDALLRLYPQADADLHDHSMVVDGSFRTEENSEAPPNASRFRLATTLAVGALALGAAVLLPLTGWISPSTSREEHAASLESLDSQTSVFPGVRIGIADAQVTGSQSTGSQSPEITDIQSSDSPITGSQSSDSPITGSQSPKITDSELPRARALGDTLTQVQREHVTSADRGAHRERVATADRGAQGARERPGISPPGASLRNPVGCSPPYFYDSDGLKTFRKECL